MFSSLRLLMSTECRKRPLNIKKETVIHQKRQLYIKSDLSTSVHLWTSGYGDHVAAPAATASCASTEYTHINQKRPLHIKRNLCIYIKRNLHISKETDMMATLRVAPATTHHVCVYQKNVDKAPFQIFFLRLLVSFRI